VRLQAVLTELLDSLRCSISRGDVQHFHTLLQGRTSTNRLYDLLRGIRQ
jgi:hypothetical protein